MIKLQLMPGPTGFPFCAPFKTSEPARQMIPILQRRLESQPRRFAIGVHPNPSLEHVMLVSAKRESDLQWFAERFRLFPADR